MNVMPNHIRDLDESYRNCTVTAFGQNGYVYRVWRTTVTVHPPLDVPKDWNNGILIAIPHDADGILRRKEGICVIIIDGHHHHDAICELRNYLNSEYQQTREPLPVFLNLRGNGKALFAMDMKNIRKLLNTTSAIFYSCSLFSAVFNLVVAYARTFYDPYEVPFGQPRVVGEIDTELMSQDLTPFAVTTMYY